MWFSLALVFAGAVAVVAGLALVWPPLALIVGGAGVAVFGLLRDAGAR